VLMAGCLCGPLLLTATPLGFGAKALAQESAQELPAGVSEEPAGTPMEKARGELARRLTEHYERVRQGGVLDPEATGSVKPALRPTLPAERAEAEQPPGLDVLFDPHPFGALQALARAPEPPAAKPSCGEGAAEPCPEA